MVVPLKAYKTPAPAGENPVASTVNVQTFPLLAELATVQLRVANSVAPPGAVPPNALGSRGVTVMVDGFVASAVMFTTTAR